MSDSVFYEIPTADFLKDSMIARKRAELLHIDGLLGVAIEQEDGPAIDRVLVRLAVAEQALSHLETYGVLSLNEWLAEDCQCVSTHLDRGMYRRFALDWDIRISESIMARALRNFWALPRFVRKGLLGARKPMPT